MATGWGDYLNSPGDYHEMMRRKEEAVRQREMQKMYGLAQQQYDPYNDRLAQCLGQNTASKNERPKQENPQDNPVLLLLED